MTVSENNIQTISSGDVSSGDALVLLDETLQADIPVIVEELHTLNFTCLALLFFTIFVWIETKIRSAVRGVIDTWRH